MRPVSALPLAVYKSKAFARFQKKARISDADLVQAARNAERGVIDADLGGGVIKQRIARGGEGKSGGSRSIVLFRQGSRLVYVYGFEKKDRANIRFDELEAFRELARVILGYSEAEIGQRVKDGALLQIHSPKEENNG
ncbi:type II toxin-antitoxin system RelE/ParE family toxin [Silvibacterium sp.]|uniref:type II toxin-antitoxin system RelE/ParE family toxin n=1 Tax=Silvibacterium sp. TaxID=1964179 RepID=UPI0039E483DD